MQLKKIVPLALALTITATASAGAANVHTVKLNIPTSITSQARQQLIQKLMEKFDFSACFPDWDIPSLKPETKPDETPELPEELPEETPDEMPDQQPESPEETPEEKPEEDGTPELPEEHPDETPEEIPEEEETPELPEEHPEETPDNTPQLPEDSRPDETPDNGTDQTPEDNTGSMQGDFASQVAALVNTERAKYGLSALTVDTRVQQAALVRAKETAQSFSHTRPNGSSFSTALTEAGVSYRTAGENIAYGQTTPQQVMNAWMNSSGHRANILNANYTTIGVGYTVINGTAYWAQLFTA